MAQIQFLAGEGDTIPTALSSVSGLGFYGPGGFGSSVQVGTWQDNTYITNGAGTSQGPKADNIKWAATNSGYLAGETTPRPLTEIPNVLATVNIRFTHTVPVKTQNVQLRIFDRNDINRPASGVVTKTAEIRHQSTTPGAGGLGDTTWSTPGGSGSIMSLTASPGMSGLRPNGADTTDVQHDTYVIISAMPDSVGSKSQYALMASLEYL
jgi:hypothetical protein